MADFSELLTQLTNPGEDGIPPTIYDDLSASYTDATSTRDAKITETSGALEAALAEINRVKAMNYDLLMAAGVADGENSGNNEPDNDVDNDDIGDDDDFFTDKD